MLDPTTTIPSAGVLALIVERGLARWQEHRHRGVSQREMREALEEVKGDVRDALSTAQLQGGLERRDLEKAIVAGQQDLQDALLSAVNSARQEVMDAMDRRRR